MCIGKYIGEMTCYIFSLQQFLNYTLDQIDLLGDKIFRREIECLCLLKNCINQFNHVKKGETCHCFEGKFSHIEQSEKNW